MLVWMSAILVSLPLAAQEPKGELPDKVQFPAEAVDAIHDEIRTMRDSILKAVKSKDVDALLTQLHPDIVLTTMDDKDLTVIRKHAGVRDYITRCLTGSEATIKTLEPSITVDELTILHGDDTGVAFGSSNERYIMADERVIQATGRWSATLVKHEGSWKVANLQFSYNPFDNPVLDAVSRLAYWIAGGAAVAGFALGLVIMRLFRRPVK